MLKDAATKTEEGAECAIDGVFERLGVAESERWLYLQGALYGDEGEGEYELFEGCSSYEEARATFIARVDSLKRAFPAWRKFYIRSSLRECMMEEEVDCFFELIGVRQYKKRTEYIRSAMPDFAWEALDSLSEKDAYTVGRGIFFSHTRSDLETLAEIRRLFK